MFAYMQSVLKQNDRIEMANFNFMKMRNFRMGLKHTEIY